MNPIDCNPLLAGRRITSLFFALSYLPSRAWSHRPPTLGFGFSAVLATSLRCATCWLLCGIAFSVAAHAQTITVTYDGPTTANTCTLAQAINAANVANGFTPAGYGSSTPAGNCTGAAAGANAIQLSGVTTVTLTTIDNYWYGPNALPPIASSISIIGVGQVTTIRAVHTGDPAPLTANAFRLFYVSGGLEIPVNGASAPSLTITNAVLQGGYAKGGDSRTGGGGAGMGGAIFNQGSLTLRNVVLIGNAAQGGAVNVSLSALINGGGGMGQDAYNVSGYGGGFGGDLGNLYGGSGGFTLFSSGGAGGGGGFISGSDGPRVYAEGGGAGGGNGLLGGVGDGNLYSGGAPGDGGGGGAWDVTALYHGEAGGRFGKGGTDGQGPGGGGGVGGGGGGSTGFGENGGGGFGGGSGGTVCCGSGSGGFGGGGGNGVGGFGGGGDDDASTTGGAGMGGAIFNHAGMVSLLNVSATGNGANGGAGQCLTCTGSALGAVLFNLNGSVTIDFSTLAGNTLSGNNAQADSKGPEDGTVYSLAYGNKIQDGSSSSATLTIHNSIIHGTQADGGLHSDVSANVVNGANANTSALIYAGNNFIGQSYGVAAVTQTGTSPSAADPLLGSLSLYLGPANANATPVLPIGSNSPAYDAAPSCLEADDSTTLTSDELFTARPQFSECDVGAYEFDGDYIYANDFGPEL